MSGQKKRRKKVKKNPKRLWVYLGLAIVILYIIIYVVPSITGALKTTYTATYGQVEIGDETTAYIVRDESVYIAETTGKVKFYCKEGDMVKKGSRISKLDKISITTEEEKADLEKSKYQEILTRLTKKVKKKNTDGICQQSGVFSQYIDGYEGKLRPKTMAKLNLSDVQNIKEGHVIQAREGKVLRTEPMYKVVSNAKWYILFWVSNEEAKKYEEYTDVRVNFEDSQVVAMVYKKVKKPEKKTLVILQTNRLYEKSNQIRKAQVSIVCHETSGLILKTDSIKEENGIKGVYVKNTLGDFEFKPIKILATKDDITIVEKTYFYDDKGEYVETVRTYDQILR